MAKLLSFWKRTWENIFVNLEKAQISFEKH